jgi:hypothetical protein
MQSYFTFNNGKQLRPVSLDQRSGGTATLADALLMEQMLPAH